MRPWLIAGLMVGCTGDPEPKPDPEPIQTLVFDIDDVDQWASGSVTGGADWMVQSTWTTWADLDQDGYKDAVLHWFDDDDDAWDEDQSWVRNVGWAKGPITSHQVPETLVVGREDPFRSAEAYIGVDDHDGDGVMDLLVPFVDFHTTWYGMERSGPTDRFAAAWFKGPFPVGAPPRRLDDPRLIEAAGQSYSAGDFNLDGVKDAILASWDPTYEWKWFENISEPTEVNVTTVFDASNVMTGGTHVRFNEIDPDQPIELFAWDQQLNRYFTKKLVQPPDFVNGGALVVERLPVVVQPMGDLDGDGLEDQLLQDPSPDLSPVIRLTDTLEEASFFDFPAVSGLYPLMCEDLNGDGYGDLLVSLGAHEYEVEGLATTWVIFGPFEPRAYGPDDARLRVDGMRVTPIGDIDGDGLADLAVDQPTWPHGWEDGDGRPSGRIWLVHGATLRDALDKGRPD